MVFLFGSEEIWGWSETSGADIQPTTSVCLFMCDAQTLASLNPCYFLLFWQALLLIFVKMFLYVPFLIWVCLNCLQSSIIIYFYYSHKPLCMGVLSYFCFGFLSYSWQTHSCHKSSPDLSSQSYWSKWCAYITHKATRPLTIETMLLVVSPLCVWPCKVW